MHCDALRDVLRDCTEFRERVNRELLYSYLYLPYVASCGAYPSFPPVRRDIRIDGFGASMRYVIVRCLNTR